MRIGIYAGVFDPVHFGHTNFAESAIKEAHLHKVVMVAEKEPYRKKPIASWFRRQEMIQIATDKIISVECSYEFADSLSDKHTLLDTLKRARTHLGKEHEYWLLVGSDVFEHMHKWHDTCSSDEYGGFVVSLRGDHTEDWLDSVKGNAPDLVKSVKIVKNNHPCVSSSKIRSSAAGCTGSKDLDPAVIEYIQNNKLYAQAGSSE